MLLHCGHTGSCASAAANAALRLCESPISECVLREGPAAREEDALHAAQRRRVYKTSIKQPKRVRARVCARASQLRNCFLFGLFH